MGGRGLEIDHRKIDGIPERFDWIRDVSTERLQGYMKRSEYCQIVTKSGYVTDGPDPKGRSIHVVGYYAEIELKNRGKL